MMVQSRRVSFQKMAMCAREPLELGCDKPLPNSRCYIHNVQGVKQKLSWKELSTRRVK